MRSDRLCYATVISRLGLLVWPAKILFSPKPSSRLGSTCARHPLLHLSQLCTPGRHLACRQWDPLKEKCLASTGRATEITERLCALMDTLSATFAVSGQLHHHHPAAIVTAIALAQVSGAPWRVAPSLQHPLLQSRPRLTTRHHSRPARLCMTTAASLPAKVNAMAQQEYASRCRISNDHAPLASAIPVSCLARVSRPLHLPWSPPWPVSKLQTFSPCSAGITVARLSNGDSLGEPNPNMHSDGCVSDRRLEASIGPFAPTLPFGFLSQPRA
jgi:hypothetical protein